MDAWEAWRRTLLEWEAVKHYHQPYALIIGWTFRNPLMEHVLPSVVLVKAVAVFDEAIENYIDRNEGDCLARTGRRSMAAFVFWLIDRLLPMARSCTK